MNRRGDGLLVFILVVVLVVVFVLAIVYVLSPKDEIQPANNSTMNKTFYKVYLRSNAVSKINYVLSNETSDLMRGVILSDEVIEEYNNVEANTSINFSGWGDDYYYGVSACNVSGPGTTCFLFLKEKAKDFSVWLNSTDLIVYPFNKTVQSPLICWSYGFSVMNVVMNLSLGVVPIGQKNFVDFCYNVGRDINVTTDFGVEIHPNIIANGNLTNVVARVFDQEKIGYQGIGYKEVGIKA